MWKKDQDPTERPMHAPNLNPLTTPDPAQRAKGSTERASIGRSITIRGDVTGDEDLIIQGRVEGSVQLEQHAVTVGPDGEVRASITARLVVVEGSVVGNLSAEEQVVLRASARVQGDIAAPRVVLEDGATFRGGVDMGDRGAAPGRGSGSVAGQGKRQTEAPRTPAEGTAPGDGKGKAQADAPAGVGG